MVRFSSSVTASSGGFGIPVAYTRHLHSASRRAILVVALIAAALEACEAPAAPDLLVYVDRPIIIPAAALGWSAVSVGGGHACGIRATGELLCWGSNTSGQLGVGTARGHCGLKATPCEASPRLVLTNNRFVQVSAGQFHTCAISSVGALFCWGDNTHFQLASPSATAVATPAPVLPAFQFTGVAAGSTHTCALRTDGVAYCWGDGTLGALGRGDTLTSAVPQPVQGSQRFTAIRSGSFKSCALAADESAWCWGAEWESASGGFDFYHPQPTAHRIDGLPPLRELAVNVTSVCALTADGAAYCWESNAYAQLGNGTLESTGTPTRVSTSQPLKRISTGITQTCAVAIAGNALCWGNNSFGQLGVPRPGQHCGDSNLECSRTPIAVFGMQQFVSIATGFGNHVCGITSATALVCWGLGSEGQLGDGFTRDRQSLPVPVAAPSP